MAAEYGYDKQAALEAFRIEIGRPDYDPLYQAYTHEWNTWLQAWQLATQVAYERAAQACESRIGLPVKKEVWREYVRLTETEAAACAEAIRNLAKGE